MPPSRERVDAIREYAVPLETTDPAVPLAESGIDLGDVAAAEIVGLGEATHGTREFFRLKGRLIRALVERLGFRTIAFEAPAAATMAADEYVTRGDGSPETALARTDRWQLRTDAVRDLLAWLRSFNEDRPREDRVRVRGVDLSTPSAAAEGLRAALAGIDHPLAESDAVASLVGLEVPSDDDARRQQLDDAEATCRTIADRLDERQDASVDRRSRDGQETARYLCRVVERNCEWHRVRHEHHGPHPAGMAARDRLMSENVALTAKRDWGDGVVLWAHNGHVQRGTFDDGRVWTDERTMGEHLHQRFGGRYVPLGFDFGRGSFRARGGDGADRDGVATFTVGEPLDGSATAAIDALGDGPRFVDLRAAGADPRLASWFGRPRTIRSIGSIYAPSASPADGYQRTDLLESYDGLFFVGESSPSRPVPADP